MAFPLQPLRFWRQLPLQVRVQLDLRVCGLDHGLGTSLSASEQEKLPTSDFFFFNLDLSLNPEEEYRKPTGGGYRKRMHFVPFLNRLEEHYFFGGFFFLNFEI